jgi:hypothetical protein
MILIVENQLLSMKGSVITDAVSTIAIIVIFVILLMMIPDVIVQVKDIFVLNSPRVVSRDLASLVTITAASTYPVEINYSTDDVKYNVDFMGKTVNVSYSDVDFNRYEDSQSPIGVEVEGKFTGVNRFTFHLDSGRVSVNAYAE